MVHPSLNNLRIFGHVLPKRGAINGLDPSLANGKNVEFDSGCQKTFRYASGFFDNHLYRIFVFRKR